MCYNPAQTFGFPRKGRIEPGVNADIVVSDPAKHHTTDVSQNHSNADYSVYEGHELTGKVIKTFVRGELVVDNGDIVAESAYGEFLVRDISDWEK